MQRIIVITGTDTGVGKTVLTALLAAHLVREGANVAALKPICSGGRGDAKLLRRAAGGWLPLATINPWHFRAPVAPAFAARAEKQVVRLPEILAHIRTVSRSQPRPDYVLVEGAGGLLSPLGEGFSTRELITGLKAEVILVGLNKLGVINQVRLTLEALPRRWRDRTKLALMSPARPDRASRSNLDLLREFVERGPIETLPLFATPDDWERTLATQHVRDSVKRLLK